MNDYYTTKEIFSSPNLKEGPANFTTKESSGRLPLRGQGLLQIRSGHLIELFLETQDWQKTREAAYSRNLAQARTLSSRKRILDEMLYRLKKLSEAELKLYPSLMFHEQSLLLWLSACRAYEIVADFAREVILENYETLKKSVDYADYAVFFSRKSSIQPVLHNLSNQSRERYRQTIFLLAIQAGLLSRQKEILSINVSENFNGYLLQLPFRERQFFPGLLQNA